MAVDVEIRPATQEDLLHLLGDMRQADWDEVEAAAGDVRAALLDGARASLWVDACVIDGELACVFGVAPLRGLLGKQAAPWMLGTPWIDKNPSVLIAESRKYVARMVGQYPHLLNCVDARNKRSIRWLKWLGFTIHPAAPYGEAQLPFHLFEMKV